MLGHVGDQVVEYATLIEKRVGSALGGVDFEMTVHAEAFAGGAEQGQKHDGEGVEEKQPVAPSRIGDAKRAHAHAEAQVRAVAEAGFDGPSFGMELDDLRRGERAIAGGQMPSFLHGRSLHADDRADLLARGGDFRVAQLPRPSALADPIGGQPRFAPHPELAEGRPR